MNDQDKTGERKTDEDESDTESEHSLNVIHLATILRVESENLQPKK